MIAMNKKFLHTVSTSLPLILVRYIEKKGFDTNILLNNRGIDQSALANPETRLTAEQFDLMKFRYCHTFS